MSKIIEIKVEDKVASLVDRSQFVVCGNTDYEIHFQFSEEWSDEFVKTALFVFGEDVVEKVFTGNVCEGVEIVNASLCRIGVYAGNIKTTTPACLDCRKSITDAAGGKVHTDPSEDIYNQIIEVVNQGFAKIEDFEEDIDGLLADVDGLKRNVTTQGGRIDGLQMDVLDIYGQLVGIGDSVAQNTQGIKDINQTIGWMSSDIGSNSYAIGQNSQKISQNTKDIAEQTKRNDITDIRLANLEHHINPDYFYTDESVAYQKLVPADAAPYAQLNSVGGMTYKSKNLLPFPYVETTKTMAGITFTVQEDGSMKVSGTSTGFASFTLANPENVKLQHGQTYKFTGMVSDVIAILAYDDSDGARQYFVGKASNSLIWNEEYKLVQIYIQIYEGKTVNETVYPMLNIGTTALPYEPYYEGLRDAKVTAIRKHGANLFNQVALDGRSNAYSVDSNGVTLLKSDAAATTTVEPFATLDAGDYTIYSTLPDVCRFSLYGYNGELIKASSKGKMAFTLTMTTPVRVKILAASGVSYPVFVGNIACVRGTTALPYSPYHAPAELALPTAITSLDGWGKGIEGYANTYDFENGTYTKYTNDGETLLQEPIITKVSTGFDPLIRVEGGGSLEFVNEYSYDAPSSITYLLQEGSV